jgi:Domain of unknown function (DUF1707)
MGTAEPPTRLASEDVIINAPMSYAGSAQRIFRLRRRAQSEQALVAITVLVTVLVLMVWVLVTVWYLLWGFWLVPYRLLRRGARKRKAEMLRHRELLGTIQGSSAASAAAIVAATTGELTAMQMAPRQSPSERIADSEREHAIAALRQHMLVGRLTAAEFEARVGAVHNATTRGELDSALADLPSHPEVSPAPGEGSG